MKKLSELFGGTLLYGEKSDRLVTAQTLSEEIEDGSEFEDKFHTIRFASQYEIDFIDEVDIQN